MEGVELRPYLRAEVLQHSPHERDPERQENWRYVRKHEVGAHLRLGVPLHLHDLLRVRRELVDSVDRPSPRPGHLTEDEEDHPGEPALRVYADLIQILNDKLDWLAAAAKGEEKPDKAGSPVEKAVLPRPSLWKESPSLVIATIFFVVVMVVADGYIVFSFNNTSLVPKQISPSVAQPMLLALIQADGVLLGFVGAVFAVIFGRSHKVNGWVLLVQAGLILGSMGFFLSTIIRAFLGLAGLSLANSLGLASSDFGQMLALSFNGVITLFVAVIASHEVQSIVERFGLGQKS